MNLDQNITENFKLSEFVLSEFYNEDQQQIVIDDLTPDILCNIQKLANQLQTLRNKVSKPILINIAFRPLWWEKLQGRNGLSQHTLGKAADIRVLGMKPSVVHKTIEEIISDGDMLQGGLGKYNTFTHYDIRRTKARW